jgi:DNA-binding response OmpR family regulator
MSRKVLVVEDDADIAQLLRITLESEHFEVRTAGDGTAGYEVAVRDLPDLIILDVMLPGLDGFELCRRFRQETRTAQVPILMLSARTDEVDKVLGLELGADDYLAKPFSPRELAARVRAILRRGAHSGDEPQALHSAPLDIDLARHEVTVDSRAVQLSHKEFGLLVELVKGGGRVFSRTQLLDLVWGFDYVGGTRTVDVHINHLRDKLPEIAGRIVTVKSVGYKYVDTPS